MQLFELLRDAAPALVDPGTTAQWEMQLDDVVTGRADFRAVIDGIAAEAESLIAALRLRPRGAVDLKAAPPAGAGGPKRPARKAKGAAKATAATKVADPSAAAKPKRTRKPKAAEPAAPAVAPPAPAPRAATPTARMVSYAQTLSKSRGVALPPGYDRDFQACRRFLDQHA